MICPTFKIWILKVKRVIFPKTDRANIVIALRFIPKCFITTAGTGKIFCYRIFHHGFLFSGNSTLPPVKVLLFIS